MKWTTTQREYHGVPDNQFVVHQEGELRGPVEVSDEDAANRIAAVLNTCPCPVKFTGMHVLYPAAI